MTSSVKRYRFAAVLTLGWTILIVGATYLMDGTTAATRAATSLCMPVGLIWMALIFACVLSIKERKSLETRLLWLVTVLLTVTGNVWVSDALIAARQWPETKITVTGQTPYRTAVVLGGGAGMNVHGTPKLGSDGERIVSAAQLWHAGLIKSITCTGSDQESKLGMARLGRELLVSMGVPGEAIYLCEGETTSHEMRALKTFFENPPTGFPPLAQTGTSGKDTNALEVDAKIGSVVLITSAFHMRRAIGLAKANGLDFEPHSVAFRGGPQRFSPAYLIPNAGAANTFGLALKEILGSLVGR